MRCFFLASVLIWLDYRICGDVVINEIHHDPNVKTELAEFIELHNSGPDAVDLSGWGFTDGVLFTFPSETVLEAGEYLVVGENPAVLMQKFGVASLGPWQGNLQALGERIELRDAQGGLRDRVEYGLGFPWPVVGEPPGYSIELIHPSLDNDLGGSWRASIRTHVAIPEGSVWRFFRGKSAPSDPVTLWREEAFDEAAWESGKAPIGYGDTWVRTVLDDMDDGYTSVFLRKKFYLENPAEITGILLRAQFDDGFKAWINGVPVQNANMSAGEVAHTGIANSALENEAYVEFHLGPGAPFLLPGWNQLAVQAHNASLGGSSDFWFDAHLELERGSTSRGPTPGMRNAVYAENAPPQMRQVRHAPKQPGSGVPVLVTAKVSDPDGVKEVSLEYQVVQPGAYVALGDSAYENGWRPLLMNDGGHSGDLVGGDMIYSVEIPGEIQAHRNLVRYRITAVDRLDQSVRGPSDAEANFAYFVYDGVPGWQGALRPGMTEMEEVPAHEMSRLPVYHLISKRADVETSTWHERYQGDSYKWWGTLVYHGEVYDHIRYRARGGTWRYAMGKNMWKFDFNRGHGFKARDNWGKRFDVPWTRLNLGASIQQGDYDHRGEQGMFESVGFRLFNLAAVEAPETTFVTFRVIDDAQESSPNQYDGDFWGLYLAVEQMNGRFLDQHGLPDGNLYKMENRTGPPGANGELNNQGKTSVSDYSDLLQFHNLSLNTSSPPTDQWFRENFDLARYYSYRTIVEGIHHYDIAYGKNYFYYNNPLTGRWQIHPWDLDLTWADNMYGHGLEPYVSRVLSRSAFNREYRNRAREVIDLLFNQDQGWQLIDEYARLLRGTNGGLGILDADRYRWDYNPIMIDSSIVSLSKAGHGRFYQFPRENVARDFSGAIQLMKNYVVRRASAILPRHTSDSSIPVTPVLSYIGPADFPANRLQFRSSNFQGQGRAFGSMKWRIGEITPVSSPSYDPKKPHRYEIEAVWETAELTQFQSDIAVPMDVLQVGRTYRARVRMTDSAGFASHWSKPVQFTVGERENTPPTPDGLVVSEIMYHPIASDGPGEAALEFIELANTKDTDLVLAPGTDGQWRIGGGIQFQFPPEAVLGAGERLLVVGFDPADQTLRDNFMKSYGLSGAIQLLGPFSGRLSNGGESLAVEKSQDPEISGGALTWLLVDEVNYMDQAPWPASADGKGHSLQRLSLTEPGSDPSNWAGAAPTPARDYLPPGSDRDEDGIPDDWETVFGLNPDDSADSAGDMDADRFSNLQEYLSGTDPRDPSSLLRITSVERTTSEIVIRFPGMDQRGYWLQHRSAELSDPWTDIVKSPPGPEREVILKHELDAGTTGGLYRIKLIRN